ncbi:hypothetical protein B9Z55_025564 [Caenorhabditis nigoni]|uniref:Uncharacterized protein n=2 Tax=Caenorhabditis nigoni TaxID=1611254 RepID=A0A2G5SYW6_9PELO|nr:hypothetical protein B9Z55_025564 [Caenorhabditis nigoni]
MFPMETENSPAQIWKMFPDHVLRINEHLEEEQDEDTRPCPTPEFVDTSFEIGVWEPVAVEPRRRRRQKAERKPHEIIDYSQINFNQIEGPPLPLEHNCERCQVLRQVKKKLRCTPYPAESCFCTECVESGQLSFLIPDLMARVTDHLVLEGGDTLRRCSKYYLYITYKGLLESNVHRPLIAYVGCNKPMIQTYLERKFTMKTVDLSSVFRNRQVQRKIIALETEKIKIRNIFYDVIYKAAAEYGYNHLLKHLENETLESIGWTFVRQFRNFDPCKIARDIPYFALEISKRYFAKYLIRARTARTYKQMIEMYPFMVCNSRM